MRTCIPWGGLMFASLVMACTELKPGADQAPIIAPTADRPGLLACGDGRVGMGELCDTAIFKDEPGACPVSCASDNRCRPRELHGTNCERRCDERVIETAIDGDLCCPLGVTVLADSDCGFCGDSIIGPNETCDPSDTCLTERSCVSDHDCVTATLVGDPATCSVRCVLAVRDTCEDSDGCCPGGCDSSEDSDCSKTCGNGEVEAYETCDDTAQGEACPKECDDHDVCTDDLSIGSGATCNRSCKFVPIEQPRDRDGCCPPGATARNDSDCQPVCGNRVAEPGEECDGGSLCSEQCQSLTNEQSECSALVDPDSDACNTCSCSKCAAEMLACYASTDASRDELCAAVVACGDRTGCRMDECYCGSSASCDAPNGPCRLEIEAAAGSTYRPTISACTGDESCALSKSRAIGECRQRECASECGVQP